MSTESPKPTASKEATSPTAATASQTEATSHRSFPWNDLWVTVAAFVLAFIVSAIVMVAADPAINKEWSYLFSRPDALSDSWAQISSAYAALFQGAFGSWQALTATTAQSAPLICGGLALGLVHLFFAVIAGFIGGAIWGGIAGILKARAGVNEVIVTIMLNYIAGGLLAWLLTTKAFQMPGRTDPIAPIVDWNATFPRMAGSQLHLGFFLALLLAVGTWRLLDRTPLGFQIRAVGSNPNASATAGMNTNSIIAWTMIISGGLAGMAGVEVALGPISGATPTQLSIGLVGTIGFDAITVALLGRSKPLGIVLAGLFWGAMNQGGLRMQAMTQTSLDLVRVIQAVIVMFVAAPMLVKTILPFLKTRREKRTKKRDRGPVPADTTTKGALA